MGLRASSTASISPSSKIRTTTAKVWIEGRASERARDAMRTSARSVPFGRPRPSLALDTRFTKRRASNPAFGRLARFLIRPKSAVNNEPSKTKILVVDDDESILAVTALALQRAGFDVVTTSEALGLPLRVGRERPKLILLDVDLPAIDGPRIAQTLRGLRSADDCVVVFHSAEPEDRLQRAVADTGAKGYIPKGLRRADFLSRVRSFLANAGEPRVGAP
jgi:PleD family two-component response regulator